MNLSFRKTCTLLTPGMQSIYTSQPHAYNKQYGSGCQGKLQYNKPSIPKYACRETSRNAQEGSRRALSESGKTCRTDSRFRMGISGEGGGDGEGDGRFRFGFGFRFKIPEKWKIGDCICLRQCYNPVQQLNTCLQGGVQFPTGGTVRDPHMKICG